MDRHRRAIVLLVTLAVTTTAGARHSASFEHKTAYPPRRLRGDWRTSGYSSDKSASRGGDHGIHV